MKIAFDLDDTLVPTTTEFSVGANPISFPFNLIFKERLRSGSIELMKRLSKHHDVWVYTTSCRPSWYVYAWFRLCGIKLGGIVNAPAHLAAVQGTIFQNLSKAPRLFDIDIIVDDSAGVATECKKQNVRCIHIKPNQCDWVSTVIHSVLKAH